MMTKEVIDRVDLLMMEKFNAKKCVGWHPMEGLGYTTEYEDEDHAIYDVMASLWHNNAIVNIWVAKRVHFESLQCVQ